MKTTQKRRNLFNRIFKGASLATVAIAFQACYGAPRDFGMDQYIEGIVFNVDGRPMQDILIVVNDDTIQFTKSNTEGKFQIYVPKQEKYKIAFYEKQDKNIIEKKDSIIEDRNRDISIRITLDK